MIAESPILGLPPEVLLQLFGIVDLRGLQNIVLVCRQFHDLAEPFLYRYITILRGHQATALASSFTSQPDRARWVRSLLISTKLRDDSGLDLLPPWIVQVS
jgi:hypothetical protein